MTELEQRLAGLAGDFPFPPTPDLAGAVGRRPAPAHAARALPRRTVLALAAVVLALGGALALSSAARGALLDLFDFVPGVSIERVDELPRMALSESSAYGAEVSSAEAERRAPFELLRPESLGEPDLAYHYRDPDGSIYLVTGDPSGGDVRRLDPDGTVEVLVGTGALGPAEDGLPATEIGILPSDVAVAPDGALLLSQAEPEPAVRRVDPETGIVTTLFR